MVSGRDTALGVKHTTFEKGWELEDLEKKKKLQKPQKQRKNPAWPNTHKLILTEKISSLSVSEKIFCNVKHSNLPLKSQMIPPLRTFMWKSPHIDFFLNFHQFEILDYLCQKFKKIGESPNFFPRYDVWKITQNLRNRASFLHADQVPVCAKMLQINPWIEILSANYCSCGSVKKIRWTRNILRADFII